LAQGAKARYQTKVVMAIQKMKIPVQMMKMTKKETRSRMPTVTRKKVMARRGVLAALERKPLDPKLRIRSLRVVLRRAGQADGVNMSGFFLHFSALIPMEFWKGGGVYLFSVMCTIMQASCTLRPLWHEQSI
jgi:hypothetical protein